MKTKKTLLKEFKVELRYFQALARQEVRWLKASREKCKEIGRKMRDVQRGV